MRTLVFPYFKTVCRLGEGAACCRYLVVGETGPECVKLDPDHRAVIDERVADGLVTARGDNCEGR